MPQTGYTPIQIYSSSTPTNAPSAGNLTNDTKGSELAINIADKNLFFKDSSNVVNTVPIRQSGAASDGWLSSTDWNTFNNKQPAGAYLTAVTADAPLSGAGTSASHLVIAQATTSTSGYLSSTDWNTFNNKQAALVSGTNIKTVGGVSLLGSGDVGTIGIAYGGTNATSFNAPVSSINGLVWYDGTRLVNDASTSHVGYNASTNTFYALNLVSTNDATVNGLTVGKGASSVANNTVLGVSTLAANTTGRHSVMIGYQAGIANTSGEFNIGIGSFAFTTNTTGNQNTAVGYAALAGTSATGSNNCAYGYASLNSNTSGLYNVAIGHSAFQASTTVNNNTGVGYQVGYTNITGAQNVLVGTRAGYSGTNTSYKVMMGYEAGYSSNFSGDSFNTFIGTQAGYFITSGIKNTIIGGYNGNQGGLDIRTASNYVVLSDGDGNPQASMYQGGSLALSGATPKAGTGITFPATQSASSDANTLDDYEEGTFTPTITASTGTITSASATGSYTKIGRQVTIYITITITNNGTGAGTLIASGLPFTCNASYRGGGVAVENVMIGTYGINTIPVSNTIIYMNTAANTYPVVTGSGYQVVATYYV